MLRYLHEDLEITSYKNGGHDAEEKIAFNVTSNFSGKLLYDSEDGFTTNPDKDPVYTDFNQICFALKSEVIRNSVEDIVRNSDDNFDEVLNTFAKEQDLTAAEVEVVRNDAECFYVIYNDNNEITYVPKSRNGNIDVVTIWNWVVEEFLEWSECSEEKLEQIAFKKAHSDMTYYSSLDDEQDIPFDMDV